MRESSKPSSVRPRGLIEAASSVFPVRVRLISSQSAPITAQQASAIRISLRGVRTPRMGTTPPISAGTVTGLVVKQ
jgi:hypothetical protein